MSSRIGSIAWTDLTVPDAERVRSFYATVTGWRSEPVSMGVYDDFNMFAEGRSEPVAGICHARGENARLPPQWLIYIVVESVAESARLCVEHGGQIVDGPRTLGGRAFCVIQDPAGAWAALVEEDAAPPSPA
jgi:uncharacterized protein